MPSPSPAVKSANIAEVEAYVGTRLAQLKGDGTVGSREPITPTREQRDMILRFLKFKEGEVGILRYRTLLAWLPTAADRLGDEFLRPTTSVQATFNEAFPAKTVRAGGYSPASRSTAALAVMQFWRWQLTVEGKPFPDHLHLKTAKWKSPYTASDMLSRDDVAKVADAMENFRDRAWLWTCYESARRPGEIYRCRYGDVQPKDGYVELTIRGEKDSPNSMAFLYDDAVPALLSWVGAHPSKDPRAPLWTNLRVGERGQQPTYRAMFRTVEVAVRRAGVTKPFTLYHLRRSKLTDLAKDGSISASVLERIAGWTQGTKVLKHYVHLSNDDVRSALNARAGISLTSEPESPKPRTPKSCVRCGTVNPADANFCSSCGSPMNLAAVTEVRKTETNAKLLTAILRKPEVADFLAKELAKELAKGQS